MPYLDNIVTDLNEQLISRSLNFLSPGKINAYGIAETIIDVEDEKLIHYPGVIDNDGEAEMVEIDDTYSLILYHRIENITNSIAPKSNYGNSYDLFESTNMALIVLGFREQVRKSAYWLEGIIKDQFPERLHVDEPSTATVLQRSNLRIGNSNFDKLGLLNREYVGVELNFLQLIIFELKYRIESTYKKGCIDSCVTC